MHWSIVKSNFICCLGFKLFLSEDGVKMTWYEARDYCRAIGGDLLSIHSADEKKAISDRYSQPKMSAKYNL